MIKKMKFFVILSCLIFSFSCASSPLKIFFPEGVKRSDFNKTDINERMTLGILGERINIGSYTASIDRSWTKTDSSDDFFFFTSSKTKTAKQTYKFKLTGSDNFSWEGKCVAGAEHEKEKIKIFKLSLNSEEMNKNNLACEFTSGDKKIILYMEGEISYKTGTIKYDDYSFDLNYSSMSQKGNFSNGASHYDIYYDDNLIALIGSSILDKALYIHKNIDINFIPAVINSAVALIVYEDLGKKIKEKDKK